MVTRSRLNEEARGSILVMILIFTYIKIGTTILYLIQDSENVG